MNLFSSAELNKILRQLKEDIAAMKIQERKNSVYTYSAGENPEDVRQRDYDFVALRDKIEKYSSVERYIRHKLNAFNSTTIVEEFGMTIDQLLMYLPELTETKIMLSRLTAMNPKERVVNGYVNKDRGTEYQCINFNPEVVKKKYESVRIELASAQLALDHMNAQQVIDMGDGFDIVKALS